MLCHCQVSVTVQDLIKSFLSKQLGMLRIVLERNRFYIIINTGCHWLHPILCPIKQGIDHAGKYVISLKLW